MMLQILANIPLFVWPLFVFLLYGGLKARNRVTMHLAPLVLIPSTFTIISFMSFFEKYPNDMLLVLYFILCLAFGFFLGFTHMQKLNLGFYKDHKKVDLPGSWLPLMLSMAIFSAKFTIGLVRSMLPHLNKSVLLLGLELFAALILGIFIGRAISCVKRYKTFANENC